MIASKLCLAHAWQHSQPDKADNGKAPLTLVSSWGLKQAHIACKQTRSVAGLPALGPRGQHVCLSANSPATSDMAGSPTCRPGVPWAA